MKARLLVLVLLVALFTLAAAPASAQSSTVTPTPVVVSAPTVIEQPIFGGLAVNEIVLIAALLLVLIGGGYFLNGILARDHAKALALADALPRWAWDALQAGTDQGLATLDTVAVATANTVDDDLLGRVKRLETGFFDLIHAAQDTPPLPPATTVTVSTPTTASVEVTPTPPTPDNAAG